MKVCNLICAVALVGLTACGGSKSDTGGYDIEKRNDWQMLNLKDSVEEYRNATSYTVFNRQGYIVEQGALKKGQKQPNEIRRYDAGGDYWMEKKRCTGLFKTLLDSDGDYRVESYDAIGRLLKELHVTYNWQGREFVDSTLYRFEIDGRKETRYVDEKRAETITYDKRRNVLSRLAYKKDGADNTLEEFIPTTRPAICLRKTSMLPCRIL
jgi:hypothetical protein